MSDLWESVKNKAGKLLPVLGNAVMPGVGGVAGSLLADALGVENDPSAIDGALDAATPEQIASLKEIELTHKERLIELGIKQDEVHVADRKDARAMQQAALQQDDKVAKRFVYYFGAFVVTASFVYIFWITFGTIPEANVRFADTILGFMLGTLVATVIQFFFGSSEGSSKKTQLMAARDAVMNKVKEKLSR